jgi:apolipoprotein D and lipocalin family protein
MGNSASSSSSLPPLQVASHCDTSKFMGTWFVIAVKPTMFEKTCSNAVEKYTWISRDVKDTTKHDIDIDFQYNKDLTPDSPLKSLPQKGWIQGPDKNDSALWKVSPFWPVKMPYLILEVDETCSDYTIIGYPSREYCWIMSRTPKMMETTYQKLTNLLIEKHQYDLSTLRKVPQIWTTEERTKRGLTSNEVPNDCLVKETKKDP